MRTILLAMLLCGCGGEEARELFVCACRSHADPADVRLVYECFPPSDPPRENGPDPYYAPLCACPNSDLPRPEWAYDYCPNPMEGGCDCFCESADQPCDAPPSTYIVDDRN